MFLPAIAIGTGAAAAGPVNLNAFVARAMEKPTAAERVLWAKGIVAQFLATLSLPAAIVDPLLKVLEAQPVEFYEGERWNTIAAGYGLATPENIEGQTTTQRPRGSREVQMNNKNYTAMAIVHELFHAISDVPGSIPAYEEGVTEYLARKALGLPFRRARGGDVIYEQEVSFIEISVSLGYESLGQIATAYFTGKLEELTHLSELLRAYSRISGLIHSTTLTTEEAVAIVWELPDYSSETIAAKTAEIRRTHPRPH